MYPRVIFFDLGQTLVQGTGLSARRLLGTRLHLSEKHTRQVGRALMTHPCEEPDALAAVLSGLLPQLDRQQLQHAVTAVWREQMTVVRPMHSATALLGSLKAAGFELGLLSNTWHPFYQGFCRSCPEIVDLLDYTFLSYRVGLKKPAVNFYRQAVAQVGRPAAACWMIGDSYELDMAPAQQAGLCTLWVLRRPEIETTLLAQVLRGERRAPDWAVENLEEIAAFFRKRKEEPC